MSKRASNRSSHNAPKSKRINIPYECLVCQTDITNNSVLFHCDCIVVICQECAILQVAAQRSTYLDGLLCPYCRRPSYNIQNIEKAKTEENALIEDAFNHLKLRPSRSNEAIKRAINAMIALGFKSSLTAEELNSEVINSPEYLPTIKLELARLQLERNSRVSNSSKSHSNDLMPLPLGPLKYLTFTRNHILERALVVTVTTSNVTSVIQGGTINAETIIPMIQKPECRSVACQTMESSFEVVNASSTSHHDDLQDHDSEPFHKVYETAPNHSAESYQLEGRSPQAPQMKNPKYASKKTQQNAIQAQIAQKQFMQQQAYYNHIMMSRAAGSGRQSAGHLPSQAASGNGNSREQYQASQGGYAGMNEAAVMGHLSGARAHSTTSSNSAPTYANNFAYGAGRPARSQPPAHQIRSTDHPSYYIGSKKIFCVCQKPASPEYYIRCCIGVGKCNGWVHPACCMDLAFKTPHELAYIESRGYSCFLCNHMVSIANSTANKRPRSDEMYLQHVGSSHKRESSYPNHNLGSKSSQRTEFPGGRTNFANVSAHAQFKARMTASGSSSQTNFTQAAFTEGSIDAMNLEGTHWQVQVSGYNHDGTPLTVGSESQQSELNTSAASSSVTAGHSKHDNEILQWMITMVQTLPILVNRTIPGKDMNSRDLLIVFRKSHQMNLQESLHSVKAVELLRRLVTLEHRTLELYQQVVALMKKACEDYSVLDADEASGTLTLDQQIVRREHKQYEHCVECEQLHQQYLALGILHNALEVCMNMYSWSYKVMKHLVTPEGRYRVTVPSDQVQGALRGAAELEAMSTRLVKESHYALTEASNSSNSVDDKTNETSLSPTTNVAKDDAQSDETKATSNSETTSSPTPNVVSDTASVADLRAVAMKLKPATGELDELERVMLENFEILCFVLIEFWRQKLILCLKKSSSSTVPLAPIPNSTTAISSATQVDETNEV